MFVCSNRSSHCHRWSLALVQKHHYRWARFWHADGGSGSRLPPAHSVLLLAKHIAFNATLPRTGFVSERIQNSGGVYFSRNLAGGRLAKSGGTTFFILLFFCSSRFSVAVSVIMNMPCQRDLVSEYFFLTRFFPGGRSSLTPWGSRQSTHFSVAGKIFPKRLMAGR